MPHPCPDCGGTRSTFFFFSKHGILSGLFFPVVFALRRCTACGREYSLRSGRRAADYARIATRALLVWIAAMVAIGVVYTLLQ